MPPRQEKSFAYVSDFATCWLASFVVAIFAAILMHITLIVARELWGAPIEDPLQLSRSWTALFWYVLFLFPIVEGLSLPLAAGFSLVPELVGVRIRLWRYAGFGTAAGILLAALIGDWQGNAYAEFTSAGAIGGLVLGGLRWR